VTCEYDGRLFHRRAAATGNALSPTVDRRVRRTSRDVDEAERKGKEGGKGVCIAIYGNPSHNYGVSLAVWDHTLLPSTRHKRTHPASTPARQAGTQT